MKFWHAVMLANNGKVEDSLPLFGEVFGKDPNWRKLLERLPASGLVKLPDSDLKRILDQ